MPRACGSALQQFYFLLPPGSIDGASQEFYCQLRTRTVAGHYNSCTAYYPKECGSALQQFECTLPLGIVVLYCSISIAYFLQAVWR